MIEHNINPVFLDFGFIKIYYYSLVYVIGILTLYFYFRYLAKNKKLDFSPDEVDSFLVYIILGILLGGRLGEFLFYDIGNLFSLEIFKLWNGGMSFHGALIGMIIAGLLFCKKHKKRFYEIADYIVMPTALFLFFGRIANFINGELVGTKTNLPFCISYKDYDNCRHPSQIYEAFKNLLIFFALLFAYYKKKFKEGFLFWMFVTLYGLLRFLTNFYRDDIRYFGLSEGQYLSLIMFFVGCWFLLKKNYFLSKKEDN